MAESTVVRTKRDHVWAITDGVTTYTIAYEPGDGTIDIPLETVNNFLDRGAMPTVPSIRKGDDQPVAITFSAYLRDIVSAADTTLMDLGVIFVGGKVSASWTSTIGTASDVKTWTCSRTTEGSDFGGSDRTLTFTYCVVRVKTSEGDPDKVDVTITSYTLRPTFS